MVVADFDVLVFLERKKEFPRREVILVASRQPDSRRHFRLVQREDAAAVKLSKNSAAEGKVADYVRFAAC